MDTTFENWIKWIKLVLGIASHLTQKLLRVLPTLVKITYELKLKAYEKVIDDHHTEDVDND